MNFSKHIITGGPGFGKTSIINELERRGHHCFHEISRSIIREQLEKGGDILPWENLASFSRLVIEKRITQFQAALEKDVTCFFDRGIPDVVAYMIKDNLELPDKYVKYLNEYNYSNKVFVTPPWSMIFVNDNERKENYQEAMHAHQMISDTYIKLGYNLIELPFATVAERVDFIEKNL